MMKRTLLVFAVALLLAGCGGEKTNYWCHPTKPMEQAFPKDRYECDGESYKRADALGERGDNEVIKREWERCMRARGWAPCSTYQK